MQLVINVVIHKKISLLEYWKSFLIFHRSFFSLLFIFHTSKKVIAKFFHFFSEAFEQINISNINCRINVFHLQKDEGRNKNKRKFPNEYLMHISAFLFLFLVPCIGIHFISFTVK